MKLIGVDVGGTFTDVMYGDTESQAVAIHKVPTTPDDPSRGVIQGMVEICERFDVDRSAVDHVLHGTTIATNAVLEYKGATTGMVTTEGYRDILHIGRHQRPQHYSIMQDVPWQDRPLVQRRHRKVVAERPARDFTRQGLVDAMGHVASEAAAAQATRAPSAVRRWHRRGCSPRKRAGKPRATA